MTKPIKAEMYLDFPTAARRARWIAEAYSQTTCVIRCPIGWGIYVSKDVLVGLRGQRMWRSERENAESTDWSEFDEQDPDELTQEFMEELALEAEFLIKSGEGAAIPLDDDNSNVEKETKEELNREILEDSFSWERSAEDGWFYDD